MQVKEHPRFKVEYRKTLNSSYFPMLVLVVGTLVSLYLNKYWVLLPLWAIGMLAGMSLSSKIRVILERQICPECNRSATLIIPKKYGRNYFSECMHCQIRWDLKVKHLPNDS